MGCSRDTELQGLRLSSRVAQGTRDAKTEEYGGDEREVKSTTSSYNNELSDGIYEQGLPAIHAAHLDRHAFGARLEEKVSREL